MKLLQRTLFAEFAKIFTLSLAVLLLFILMGQAIQLRGLLLGLEMGVLDMLSLFGYLIPFFLQMVTPIATMLTVFLAFLRMSNDRELVALKAGGVSLYQMLSAPLIFSVLSALFTLWVSLTWISWGMGNFRATILEVASQRARIAVQAGVFNKEIPGMVFYARNVDPVHGTLAQVIVDDASRPDAHLTILAPEGRIGTDYDRGEVVFFLRNGRIYNEWKGSLTTLGFDEYALRLDINKLFAGVDLGPVKPREMSWEELTGLPVETIIFDDPRLANKIVIERHKRWVFPFACLALGLMAIPLATAFQGMHRQTGLITALLFFLFYYGVISLGISMGESGLLSPWWGLWLPNLAVVLASAYALYLADQERVPHMTELFSRLRERSRARRKAKERAIIAGGGE